MEGAMELWSPTWHWLVSLSTVQQANQSINQLINQSINQSVNQIESIEQLIDLSTINCLLIDLSLINSFLINLSIMKYSIEQHLYVTGSGLQFTQDQGLGYRMPLSIPVCRQKALEVSTGSFHCLIHDKPRPQLHPSLVQLHQQPHQPGRSTPNSFLTTHTEWLPGVRLRYMYSVQHIKKILRGW